jgi:hypothetical protein
LTVTGYPPYPVPATADPPDPVAIGGKWLALVLLFGVALPVLCLFFDPVVFRSPDGIARSLGAPVVGPYRVAGYAAAAVGMGSILTWVARRRPAGLLAGLLAGGALFALALGLVLLPLSLFGMLALIGVLGFVPFGTAWVFACEARAAWRSAGGARGWAVVGLLFAIGVPWGMQAAATAAVRSAVAAAGSDDPAVAERGVERLGWLWFAADADDLVWAWEREPDDVRRRGLANAYRRLTGESVEDRLLILRD